MKNNIIYNEKNDSYDAITKANRNIASVQWHYIDGKIHMYFSNNITRDMEVREYKTERGARAAETRFFNRMMRIYSYC